MLIRPLCCSFPKERTDSRHSFACGITAAGLTYIVFSSHSKNVCITPNRSLPCASLKRGGVILIPFRSKRAAKVQPFLVVANKRRKLFFEAFLFSVALVPFRLKRAAKVSNFLLSERPKQEKVFLFSAFLLASVAFSNDLAGQDANASG